MYGINEKVYSNLIGLFRGCKDINKVILFGSRAKGNAKINSDIDLCIDYSGAKKAYIVEEISDVVGVYSCDIIFHDSMNEEIKNQIDRYGIVIFER